MPSLEIEMHGHQNANLFDSDIGKQQIAFRDRCLQCVETQEGGHQLLGPIAAVSVGSFQATLRVSFFGKP